MTNCATELEIRQLPESEWVLYADLLNTLSGVLPCQSLSWLRMLREVVGGMPGILGAFEGGVLKGALPYCLSADRGGGTILNSLPFFGSNGSVLAAEEYFDVCAAPLANACVRIAEQHRCRSATIIASPFTKALDVLRDAFAPDVEDGRIGQVVVLPRTEEELMSICSPCKRNNVRRARKLGVEVRASQDVRDWEWVMDAHYSRMQAMGGLPKPKAFFDWAWGQVVAGEYELLMAVTDTGPCAGLLMAFHGDVADYLLPASDWEQRQFKGIQLLIFEALHKAIRDGRKYFNFGGTWHTQDNLHGFKKRFGARDMPYQYLVRLLDRSLLESKPDDLLQWFPFYYSIPFSLLEK